MRIEILAEAEQDFLDGYRFYESQSRRCRQLFPSIP